MPLERSATYVPVPSCRLLRLGTSALAFLEELVDQAYLQIHSSYLNPNCLLAPDLVVQQFQRGSERVGSFEPGPK
jgi:hypothetical protein